MSSSVSALITNPHNIIKDYDNLLEIGKISDHISPDSETLIKLNLSWSLYYPACSTEPWQLDGVASALRSRGYHNLTATENRTVVTKIEKGVVGNKWSPVLQKYNIPFIPLTDVEWKPYQIHAETPALDEIFEGTHTLPSFFVGKNMIHLPTVKTHGHTTMTGAMKNAFGGLITERRHHCHRLIHEVLVDLLKIQKEIHQGIFAIMDGAVCGNGPGPRTMIPYEGNILLASHDQVAIDSISAKIMGFDPMQIPFIRMAHDEGLGCGDPDQIEILGDDISNLNFRFFTGKSPVVAGDQLFRKGKLSFLEPLVFKTSLFMLAVFGSAFYHDYLWYNLVGRRRIHSFSKTPWGRLFDQY
ncbi:DUF362 domain-containing protein [Methanospirillum stamsii]|uniref:Iron-sulfur cluster-binding protein n=1 Tax=Methanospirillum stamsii TaxID=1277351 RepID=A0A2V2MVE4_9EURY|nr:DUF362 domain-containing protein [Methanospirillum stamsii]PWR71872.1 iron-sulfur cluster-binding protein [Methanospirillum stamsii]